ncbi:zinc finger protein 28-like [Anopheles maculipalpis]|uniref:zinc finger protein 28-like n=1 Tax=Anopheles maculipalpis TaxID=1496333 RepID=UPI0021593924|nr:zinc finger protein 28-like [Anopheles maculipalpis]
MSLKCRICLEFTDSCTFLFGASSDATTLADVIETCAGIKLTEDDDLPSHICVKCCDDAESAFLFVKKCRHSERTLQAQKSLVNDKPTQHLVVEFLTQSDQNRQPLQSFWESSTPLASPDDIYLVEEYLDEDKIQENTDHESDDYHEEDDVQEDSKNLPPLNNQSSEGDSCYYCCHGDCSLTFHYKQELKRHIRLQHRLLDSEQENDPHKCHFCSNCDQAFPSAKELATHGLLWQLKGRLLNPASKGRPKAYPCLFNAPEKKCCDCYASFPTIKSLLQHTVERHLIRKTVHDPKRPVRCELCFKLFRCKASLYTHQNAPYKPRNYSCSTCDASFPTRSRLAAHEPVHSTERRYVCEECGARFKNEQNLSTHSLLHREKQEVCNVCGLRFHRKSNLRMHQRIHTDAYYAACPHCEKKCKNQSQLKEHLKVHTKEKSFACRYCAKRFMYTSDRKRHEMTHTGVYPFVCVCARKFTRNRLYQRHITTCSKASNS